MAYIGIDPNVGDITFQKFSGTGSATSFTLSQSVASGEAILVTVGNVIQEPGVTASYIAQGTTLTFSEAPANGDDIVVRFLGRAIDQPLSFAMQLFKYVATSNQTVFTGADSTGTVLAFGSDVDVYLNGVHLDTTDFTLSGGNTITLASGATVNDELDLETAQLIAEEFEYEIVNTTFSEEDHMIQVDESESSENDVTRGRTVILRQDFPVVGLRLPQVTGRQYLSVSRHENEEFNWNAWGGIIGKVGLTGH